MASPFERMVMGLPPEQPLDPVEVQERLREKAAEKWEAISRTRVNAFAQMSEEFAKSPDVLMKPKPFDPWTYPGIEHTCGGKEFAVDKWVTVNGLKSRFSATCLQCDQPCVWDWERQAWLGN